MADYVPPLRDIAFTLDRVVDLPGVLRLPAFAHLDASSVQAALEEAGRFMAEVLAPLNAVGDRQGCTLHPDGRVTTPDGFRDAYRRYVDAGWGAVPFEPEVGGGGFPWVVGIALQEMMTSANMAFSLCPLLTQGAIDLLSVHGSEELRRAYLPRLVTGEWSGTMNLTEPQAGSDVGALRTRAEPAGDGSWRITGTKIFITYGDHDLTDNIVHLVLARTPGAPPGTRGISTFLVPKYLPDADGRPGARNDVRCVALEHKLGIHASPTCVMSYGDEGGAVGWLVGEEQRGMRTMFTMMNQARLSVGLSGLSLAVRAHQDALAFARERRQGRSLVAPPEVEASPIVEHPDVRRMLMTSRAGIDAMRALVYETAATVDRARHHPDEDERRRAQERVDLLTPVAKAWPTDLGFDLASLAVQVHGGMGYVEEAGVAQHLRDVRIASIYEGTNGIQAMDLVARKLPMRAGGVVQDHLAALRSVDADLAAAGPALGATRANLAAGVDALERATGWLLANGPARPADALAGATPYLRLFGLVTGGWLLARTAVAATRAGAEAAAGDGSVAAKVAAARFYGEQLLPQAPGLVAAVTAGVDVLDAVDPALLGP